MIEKTTVYTVICDNCGADSSEDDDNVGCANKALAMGIAINYGFIQHDGKYYCYDCYYYDGDDNLIINKERSK